MIFSRKYRIYPNSEQIELIKKHFGCSRLIYNLGLECKTMAYSGSKKNLNFFDLANQLKDLKNEFTFLKEINSQSLQMPLRNLDTAYKNFFKGNAKFPKFKSKRDKQSFQAPQNVKIIDNKLSMPKFKEGIKIIIHRRIGGKIKLTTISRTPTNKYFVSFVVENNKELPKKKTPKKAVGIDLGIKDFAILSNGIKFTNPKYLHKNIDKLKWLQKRVSKKVKGSNRKKLFNLRIARLHEKIFNQRTDFLHKVSDSITKNFDTICIEDLAVSNMVKNHNLAQAITDVSWRTFRTFLEYKSKWRGNNLIVIGRFTPSSKLCNNCGYINSELELKDRTWTCPNCFTKLDRDVNASKNILHYGLKNLPLGRRLLTDAELPTLVGAMKRQSSG